MEKVIKLIEDAKSIAILAHDNEDADAIGSSYALRLALISTGKKVDVYLSEDIINYLSFMGRDYQLLGEDVPEYDLCLCLDCADIFRIGERKAIFDKAKHTACIDHHETNEGFADANYVDAKAPATGEIIYTLLGRMGIGINREIA